MNRPIVVGGILCLFALCSSVVWGQVDGPSQGSKRDLMPASDQVNAIVRGRELYLGYGCAVCHGAEGRGDGPVAEKFYPFPIDFSEPEAYRQGFTVDAIRRSIKFGISRPFAVVPSAMPAYDHLTEVELDKIARYINSLQKHTVDKSR